MKNKIQKISTQLPQDLLDKAMTITHKGITETIKVALENLITFNAYRNIRNLKGKVKFTIDIKELRKDK